MSRSFIACGSENIGVKGGVVVLKRNKSLWDVVLITKMGKNGIESITVALWKRNGGDG
jgi:hypothetical protein